MLKRLDQPEIWLTLQGFLVAFAWEMFQMPFYDMGHLSAWEVTRSCALASIGDAGIMVLAYQFAALCINNRLWMSHPTRLPTTIYLVSGLVITIAVEAVALRSKWGWAYSDLMPTVGSIGIVPIIMWLIVPMLALLFARSMTRTR